MATKKTKATPARTLKTVDPQAHAILAKKPVVKKVGRSGTVSGAKKPVVTDKTKNTAVGTGVPCALVEKAPRKRIHPSVKPLADLAAGKPAGRAKAKKEMFDAKMAGTPVAKADPQANVKLQNSSISGAHAPMKKVAAKKSAVVPSHSPSEIPAPSNSTQSAASSAPISVKQVRHVNHDSPISDKDAMREIMNGIIEANSVVPVTDNAAFLDHVVTLVKVVIGGRTFGASTYERLIRSALNAEQIKARKPLFTGLPDAITRLKLLAAENVAPEGGKPEAIAAAITKAVEALNTSPNGTDVLGRKDISKLVRTEQISNTRTRHITAVNTEALIRVLGDAHTRANDTILEFHERDREALLPFVTFFERFWGVIEHRVEVSSVYSDKSFRAFLDKHISSEVHHGEYVRYNLACGTRAIVLNSMAGSALLVIAQNEFVASLKANPVADEALIEEQSKMNPPSFHFMSSIPRSLSALVRCDIDQPGLSLMVLNRVFGDPIDYMLHHAVNNLADAVEDVLEFLVDAEAATPSAPRKVA